MLTIFFSLFTTSLLISAAIGDDNVTSTLLPQSSTITASMASSTPSLTSSTVSVKTTQLPNNTTTTISMTERRAYTILAPQKVPCPDGFLNSFITEGSTPLGSCSDAEDCLDIGFGNDETWRLDAYCRFSEDFLTAGCCYKDTSAYCQQGVSTLPSQKCETLDDCNMRNGQTTERWCDPVSKMCCRAEHDEQPMLCPDNTTALMNEPACTGYSEKDERSGKCPMKNGICYRGHCCPPVFHETYAEGKRHRFVITQVNGTSYETRHKCTNSTVIPYGHLQGYCNPRTGTVWILGTVNSHGQPNKMLPSFCHTALDCGQSSGLDNVCVRETKYKLRCYVNPETSYYVAKAPNLMWVSVFSYTALATSFCSLVFAIIQRAMRTEESSRRSTKSESQPLVPSVNESQRVQ